MSAPAPPPRGTRPRKASTAASHAGPSGTTAEAATGQSGSASTSTPANASGGGGPSVIAPTAIHSSTVGPQTITDCEHIASQLTENLASLQGRRKVELAVELRDSAENARDYAFYEKYLSILIPPVLSILKDERSIVFMSKEHPEHRFRHTLLTFLQRLPRTEPFRQHEAAVMEVMVRLLRVENEENALICIKVMIDGFRNHKDQAEPMVESFLDCVKEMYKNLRGVVEKEFGASGSGNTKPASTSSAAPATPATPVPATPASGDATPSAPPPPTAHHPMARSLFSPKVLTECPIAVVLVFQTYKSTMATVMSDFYPLVLDMIKVQPEAQRIAQEEAKKRNETFIGVNLSLVPQSLREMYGDVIKAQVKTMAFIAYVLRGNPPSASGNKDNYEIFPESCIRLLRDCPIEDVATRKELLIATRHILTSESRAAFIPYIDPLLDERILVGTGITSREQLRPLAYSVVADLIHHVRNELPLSQLMRVVHVFSVNLNDSVFNGAIQTMCAKLLNTLVDSIHQKADHEDAVKVMKSMFFTCLEKLMALTEAYERLKVLAGKDKGKKKAEQAPPKEEDVDMEEGETKKDEEEEQEIPEKERLIYGWGQIEQAMPIHSVSYANDSLEAFLKETRFLFKTLLHTFKTLLALTRLEENPFPQPDGEQLSKLFKHSFICLSIFESHRDGKEQREAIDLIANIFLLFEPHVFSSVWTEHMSFFMDDLSRSIHFYPVAQMLATHAVVSHQLVAILLKYLLEHLGDLGTQTPQQNAMVLKLFKMSFLAINTYIATNESTLVPHLQKLIMKCFEYAAEVEDPSVYYQILRALFRAIGGGRFEQLYKEVLPILQEMLDTLAYLLAHATENSQRDLFVELTLTVPVRLTNLLPLLSYLMKPLVHALKAGPDMVSQGLRTLELCIDNLTAEFLDPTMKAILPELMDALQRLLKPIPANRTHSTSAIRILGKLGGRNRRFLEVDHSLEYKTETSKLPVTVYMEGKAHNLGLEPLVNTACDCLRDENSDLLDDSFQILTVAAMAVLQTDGPASEGNSTFHAAMKSLFLSTQNIKLAEKANEFVRDYCKRVFAAEMIRKDTRSVVDQISTEMARKRYLSLTNAVADCFVETLAAASPSQREGLCKLLAIIMGDFRALAPTNTEANGSGKNDPAKAIDRGLQTFVHRFCQLCHEEDWEKKMAGMAAIRVVAENLDVNRKLLLDLEVDFVRALLFCLRDAPPQAPKTAPQVTELIKHILKICQGGEDGGANRLMKLVETLVIELHSQSQLSREAAQQCLETLAETVQQPLSDLIKSTAESKLLDTAAGPIYSKPLRALPFPMQVANIDAVTYLMSLRPNLVQPSEEFTRLLHEVIALADVGDEGLSGKASTQKQEFWMKSLRIACLKLLRAGMGQPEFLKHPSLSPLRARIIQVYFKHVYSHQSEVVDVAHDGLRDVLQQQAKLPKEVLQSGLRPILVNLADAKRLSVSGLDGLARFLELLTNYFKVEIGVKLLEHFEALAEPQMLQKAAMSPLDDNPDIARMSRLVNIFRLLPASAIQYLQPLTNHVVNAEAQLHQTTPGPFTTNMAKYLDQYANEATQNLFNNISNPRYIWTYRNVIQSGHAPNLVQEMSNKAEALCALCFKDVEDVDQVLPCLLLLDELSKTDENWLSDRENILEALVGVWRNILVKSRNDHPDVMTLPYQQMPTIILRLFMRCLSVKKHVALLYHLVEAFEIKSSIDRSEVSFFLYQQTALHESVEHRQECIEHFFNLYDEPVVTWAFKANALRLVINPLLRIYFSKENDRSLIKMDYAIKMLTSMWKPLQVSGNAKQRDDDLLIELFVMTDLMIANYHSKLHDCKKDIFKFSWNGINLLEPTVKLTAYIVATRFMYVWETPPKFYNLTWTGLLRLKDNENRILYRQAIDVLAECLLTKNPATEEAKNPTAPYIPSWALRVRSILIEESNVMSQLVTVCELLVNHPDLFYEYREYYVPQVANSLGKLAFVQNASSELRKLTVDVVELIFRWEKKRQAVKNEQMEVDEIGSKRKSDKDESEASPMKRQKIDRAGTAASSSSGGGWAASTQVREAMCSHLLRMVATSSEPISRGGLTKRALDLFKEILGPNGLVVHVKLSFFSRTMRQDINENTINVVANSTETIAAVASHRDHSWVKQNLNTLTNLLEKVWLFDESSLHEIIEPLTDRMFTELPEDETAEGADADSKKLFKFVSGAVTEGLNQSLRSSASLPGTLFLLRAWLRAQPKQIQNEAICTGLLKVLQNLSKVHTSANASNSEPTHRLIISVLDVLRGRVAELREHRRTLHGVVLGLIDRSSNLTLCRYLLETLKQWVLDDPEPTSLGKEKATMLSRMAVFEQREDALFQRYLDLVYDIYQREDLRSTDLTHRLESAFLLGTRSRNQVQRLKFLDMLEQSLPRTLDGRLQYLYSLQNWDTLSDSYWIPQMLSMLLAILDSDEPIYNKPLSKVRDNDPLLAKTSGTVARDLIKPIRNLIHTDNELARKIWVFVFPLCWSSLTRVQQQAFTPYITKLLSKDYHKKQVDLRPNVIQTFLEGVLPCSPAITLPPLLVKYLAKTFNAWYVGFEILDKLTNVFKVDEEVKNHCMSALSELYAELCEDDMYYGLARTRCVFPETIAGLTYEQNGNWPKAIEFYEQAQLKARSGSLPFSEDEYCLWEDHWVLAAQKLQNWDSLTELARTDQDSDLLLECAWRISDWGSSDRELIETNINRVIDTPTPRRKVFEAFCTLLKSHSAREPPNDFLRVMDETQQVSLKKWTSLPNHITAAHLPLLQMFQQCVELGEAAQVFDSLQMTNQQNLEMRVNTDLKNVFTTWRERLPNFWDDISVWSDLLAWRQHVFQVVTKVYVPLIPQGETATYGFRGYHETAWTINRFGEMARRHGLLDVCSSALNRIYSLPNIEISEAFLKLREQALCFFQKPDKFNEGLENLSTTNLVYFAPPQKAEFLTLKGMFIARLGQFDDANAEFAHAIQMDMNLPKAWAEWGRFNDRIYRDRPETVSGPVPEPEPGKPRMSEEEFQSRYARDRAVFASSAVSCYLQAAGLYNSHKSRALLLRILWLLGLDDSNNTIAKAFENYKGDLVVWYWITLIPQLLLSLSHREAKQAKQLLMRIAKMYPQAIFYQLRVTKDDFGIIKRQQLNSRMQAQKRAAEEAKKAAAAAAAAATAAANASATSDGSAQPANGDVEMADGEKSKSQEGTSQLKEEGSGSQANSSAPPESSAVQPAAPAVQAQPIPAVPPGPRQPWELVDEVTNLLKTAFPLLTLTMEKMVDQIQIRAKPASDEDIYRFFAALLADALQQWGSRNLNPNDDGDLNESTKENLKKFSTNLAGDLRFAIERDFMNQTPKLREYIKRLQNWRDRYEKGLDARPKFQPLDQGGCNLIEFHHTKFDDVEIPGQYVQHVDKNEDFIKIARFLPRHELARGHGHCFRRITMIGNNGSPHSFSVQLPAARHCRREERLTQLFRILNSVLKKRKEARRRNIQFHLPAAVALAPQLRLVENDSSYITLQDIYDDFCKSKARTREESIMAFYDRVKQLHDPTIPRNDPRSQQLKAEIMEEVQTKMVPENILTNFMIRSMATPESLWLMRKEFAAQTAAVTFLTYFCCLNNRTPNRFHLSRRTGMMYMTEILPGFAAGHPLITSSESVPFRLTPNMQHFITRTGLEGVVTATITAISKSLTAVGFDLPGTLHLFVRDELLTWQNTYLKDSKADQTLTKSVHTNVDAFILRAQTLGRMAEPKDRAPNAPIVSQVIVKLISQATSPLLLAQMNELFMPWY